MPLEATIICLDNSSYARNSDYPPTRFSAACEAIHALTQSKLNANQESMVGLLTMSGAHVDVLVSPTRSSGAIQTALATRCRLSGVAHFAAAIKTAALALKNRQNKNQRQRIVVFQASPLETTIEELIQLAKQLRKNNIAVDIINFGSENTSQNDNVEKFESFISALNTNQNDSHLLNVPVGPHHLADMVMASPVMSERAAVAETQVADMGETDPEMAMAIRISMEEERQRQARIVEQTNAPPTQIPMEDDEEALLQQAIAMSMQTEQGDQKTQLAATSSHKSEQLDQSASQSTQNSTNQTGQQDLNAVLSDPNFLNQLLQGVGVQTSESEIQNLANSMGKTEQKTEEKKEEKKDDKK